MQREILPDGTVLYSGPRGMTVVQRLAPGVLLLTALGDLDGADPEGPMQDFERELAAHGSIELFFDLRERKAVANSSRKPWTDWASKHAGRIRAHMLVASKLVAMTISVMAMLAGGIPVASYSEVAEMERALVRRVPGLKRMPPLPAKARPASRIAG